jgi:3-oxoacyl-[acyl-carrier protein] reductase
VIVVLGGRPPDNDVEVALAAGLSDGGEEVFVGVLGTSADDVVDVLARAEDGRGTVHGVVLATAGTAATQAGELADIDAEQWRARVELPLRRTLACFQGVHRRLRSGGGALIVLVPTLGLVGASGYVPWAAVAEGQRSMAKSAARVWGADKITVNCVAVPGALLRSPPTGSGTDPDRPGQPAPALDASADLRSAVAPVVASLASGPWTGVTGATIAVDGGVWMTP